MERLDPYHGSFLLEKFFGDGDLLSPVEAILHGVQGNEQREAFEEALLPSRGAALTDIVQADE